MSKMKSQKKVNKTLCLDFDGTLVVHAFPNIGLPIKRAFEVAKKLKDRGYKLILFTCRENILGVRNYLDEAVDFCRKQGLEFDAVNENVPGAEFAPGSPCNCRKPLCDYFIDDRNWESSFEGVDWNKIEQFFLNDSRPMITMLGSTLFEVDDIDNSFPNRG